MMCREPILPKESFRQLLTQEIDLEFTYDYQEQEVTPLMLTSLLNNKTMTSCLLGIGANPQTYNNKGETALTIAKENGDPELIAIIEDAIEKKRDKKTK